MTEALAQAAQDDDSEAVRIAALGALRRQARLHDIQWLSELVKEQQHDVLERTNALEAIFMTISRYIGRPDVRWMDRVTAYVQPKELAVELALIALSEPNGDLTYTAASRAYLVGDEIAPRLIEIILDEEFSDDIAEAACISLGKLKCRGAVDLLFALLRQEPDVPDDEEHPLSDFCQRLARSAAEALTRIDLTLLLHEPGQSAHNALGHFSVNTGCLVSEEYILDINGRVMAGSKA